MVILYLLIALLDPYGLYKKGWRGDFLVCSFLYLLSFAVAFSLAVGWKLPSPTPIIETIVKSLF